MFFSLITRAFLILFIGFQAQAHNLEESIKMVESELVRTNILLIKYKDSTDIRNLEALIEDSSYLKTLPAYQNAFNTFKQNPNVNSRSTRLAHYFYTVYRMEPSQQAAIDILKETYQDPRVEFAYFEPLVENAVMEESVAEKIQHQKSKPSRNVPDFESKQFYLEAPPLGVNARAAWEIPGGTGKGIRVIDIESGWNINHVEFKKTFWGNEVNSFDNHGTAVWGQISAKRDGVGVTGIAYDSEFGFAGSFWNGDWEAYFATLVTAIDQASQVLEPGDVLVIEQHAPGPTGNYIPTEYWQAVFDGLKAVTEKGVHCVAAAGNGSQNLDDPRLKQAFDLNFRDSGCVIVGAGGPPELTHLERLDFSNYGSRVDAFGYGRQVTTTGYGDLYREDKNTYYTARFSGTSSATPIVTGAVVSILGIAKEQNKTIAPIEMRSSLRNTGTLQKGNTSERIGTLPNILELKGNLNL